MSVSTSRRAGDEYQDIYGWFRALELLRPAKKVARVSIEDTTAGFFDDVTVRPEAGTSHAPEFIQVKFHVNLAGSYSAEGLTTKLSRNRRTLLQKAWDTWNALREDEPNLQLLLVSTWAWDGDDPIAAHLRWGSHLDDAFVDGRCGPDAAAARAKWMEHLDTPDEARFEAFLRSLRFRLGYPPTEELMRWTADVMELVGLKHDEAAILVGGAQIHSWIVAGKDTIARADMLDAIDRLDLKDPGASAREASISLFVHTILKEPLEVDGDYELDWRDHFEGGVGWERGHSVRDPSVWNAVMLPELVDVRKRASADSTARLLRARGYARLSAWFAIGYVFSPLAGFKIEVDQNGQRWRNDAALAKDLDLVEEALEERGGDPDTLAVGVSLTAGLGGDVRKYLADSGEPAGSLLLVTTNRGYGRTIRDAGDLTALADLLQARMRSALGHRPSRILLFYLGPLAGAAFIGARLNAVAPVVQIYEDQNPGYAPSFTLTF